MAPGILRDRFHDVLGTESEPAASFEFHRLRHTWATRMINNHMSLPVLQKLGGWKSLKSLQIYAKVYQSLDTKSTETLRGYRQDIGKYQHFFSR